MKKMLNFNEITEEEMIKIALECDIPLLLKSKSEEVIYSYIKKLDKNFFNLDLNVEKNFSEQILNIFKICENNSKKNYILYLNNILNAKSEQQAELYNLILRKNHDENKQYLKNCKIVAGFKNDQNSIDELTNDLANLFVTVDLDNIKFMWIDWANENNIHPIIYTFLAYKSEINEDLLCNNENFKKCEIASKMLYVCEKPQIVRSIFNKEIADEFIDFCKKITDVMSIEIFKKIDNYDQSLQPEDKYVFIAAIILGIHGKEYDYFEYINDRFDKNGNIIFNELLKLKNKKNSEDRLKNK